MLKRAKICKSLKVYVPKGKCMSKTSILYALILFMCFNFYAKDSTLICISPF